MKNLVSFLLVLLVSASAQARTVKGEATVDSSAVQLIERPTFAVRIPRPDTRAVPIQTVSTPTYSNGVLGIYSGQWDGIVNTIFPGSDCAGKLKLGDRITAIDGVYGSPLEVQKLAIGPPGTKVRVTVLRQEKELTYTIIRTDWRIYQQQGLPYQYASPVVAGLRH